MCFAAAPQAQSTASDAAQRDNTDASPKLEDVHA